jgi:hypothetical protein
MTVEQALSIVAQACAQARVTLQEHQIIQEALGVLKGLISIDQAMVGDQGETNG